MRDIAVAGAGIGGLTAALALARLGARVAVFDRVETLEAVGAGVQLSPPAVMVLDRLGVLDLLRRTATTPTEVLVRRARDGAVLSRVPLGDAALARYGAPFLTVLRADLQAALLAKVAEDRAIHLTLGREIVGYAAAGAGVHLRFADGSSPTRVAGLVAADGLRSAIRRQMTVATGPDDLRAAGRSAWRSLVPRQAADPEDLLPRSNLWLGRNAHLVHYPVAGGALVNVVAIIEEKPSARDPVVWSQPAEAAVVERRLSNWTGTARRLIAAAPSWRKWPLFDRPALRRWSEGAVTLLGDAAHPMVPFLAQGAAQAIEDAASLADAIARSPGDLPAAFLTYEGLRRPRTARVQATSRKQGTIYHLGPPASVARDLVMAGLGRDRLVARLDWLYEAPVEVRRFAGL